MHRATGQDITAMYRVLLRHLNYDSVRLRMFCFHGVEFTSMPFLKYITASLGLFWHTLGSTEGSPLPYFFNSSTPFGMGECKWTIARASPHFTCGLQRLYHRKIFARAFEEIASSFRQRRLFERLIEHFVTLFLATRTFVASLLYWQFFMVFHFATHFATVAMSMRSRLGVPWFPLRHFAKAWARYSSTFPSIFWQLFSQQL